MYIVLFNVGSSAVEVMTDGHGFIEEFETYEDANNEANEWIDEDQYFHFTIYEKSIRP